MVIRIPRKLIVWMVWIIASISVLAGLYFLGRAYTPRAADGRPVLLSPSVWAAERYRHRVRAWIGRMRDLDAGLAEVLQSDQQDPAALYDLSDRVQELASDATDLLAEITFSAPPVALTGLQEQALTAAQEYWKAAGLVAHWVSAPEETARAEARAALDNARSARRTLEQNRWLHVAP